MFLLYHILVTLVLLGLTIPFHGCGLGHHEITVNASQAKKLVAQVEYYKRQLNARRKELKQYKNKNKSMTRQIQLCHAMIKYFN